MNEVIVSTRPNRQIDVIVPDERAILCLATGAAWPDSPYHDRHPFFWAQQFASKVRAGAKYKTAWRFCRGMYLGGVERRDAIELIAELTLEVNHMPSVMWEVLDRSELPTDRRYRLAWRRGLNGGPIEIDETIKRLIDHEAQEAAMWEDFDEQRAN